MIRGSLPRQHRFSHLNPVRVLATISMHWSGREPSSFNWKSLSVAAGLTVGNFYFRLYAGSVKKAQVVDFLQALVRHLRLPLLVVWDRLPAHRSRLVEDYIASLQGWIHTEYLPPYAPELNPVEFIWAHWKQHELPNVCLKDYYQLTFWQQASLWPE